MAIATVTNGSFICDATTNSPQPANAIANAFIAAGYTLFDSYSVANVQYRVFRWIQNPAKTFGTFYLNVGVLGNGAWVTFSQQLFSTWDALSHTGTSPGSIFSTIDLSNNSTLSWSAYDHPEGRFIINRRAGSYNQLQTMGLLKPSVVPGNWDENAHAHAFAFFDNPSNISIRTNLYNAGASTPNGGLVGNVFYFLSTTMTNVGLSDATRTVFEGLQMFSNALGQAGGTFADIGLTQSELSYSMEDETSDGFKIISNGNNFSLAIRVA